MLQLVSRLCSTRNYVTSRSHKRRKRLIIRSLARNFLVENDAEGMWSLHCELHEIHMKTSNGGGRWKSSIKAHSYLKFNKRVIVFSLVPGTGFKGGFWVVKVRINTKNPTKGILRVHAWSHVTIVTKFWLTLLLRVCCLVNNVSLAMPLGEQKLFSDTNC